MTGIRQSLRTAIEKKKDAPQVVEVLSSEDIGKLPDASIGEALGRLPGLATNRDRGNVTSISIRGMGPELVNTLLNGREIVTAEANRNVRYETFPAELITGAYVYKSPQASNVEGAIAGQINLQTVRPLDAPKSRFLINLKTSYNEEASHVPGAKKVGFIGGVSYIGKFLDDTLGVAVGYSARYEPEATARSDIYGSTNSYQDLNGNGTYNDNIPYGFGASLRSGEDKRNAVLSTVQWKPDEHWEFVGDFMWANLHYKEAQRGPVVDQLPYGNVFSDITTVGDTATGATAYNYYDYGIRVQAANQFYRFTDNLYAGGLNGAYQDDHWRIDGDIGYSTTKRDALYVNVITQPFDISSGTPTLIVNDPSKTVSFQSNPGGAPIFKFNGYDLADPNTNLVTSVQIPSNGGGAPITTDRLLSLKGDVDYAADSGVITHIRAGLRYTDRRKSYTQRTQTITPPLQPVPDQYLNDPVHWDQFGYPDTESIKWGYVQSLGLDPTESATDKGASWVVKERTYSGYVQADFAGPFLGGDLTGNAGIRVVRTEETSLGNSVREGADTNYLDVVTPVSYHNNFTDVLPNFNATWKLNAHQQFRLALSKAIARAPLDYLNPGKQLYTYGAPAAYGGNPYLRPFKADQVDLTFENYFNKDTALTLALFYKKLDTYIATQVVPTSFTVTQADGTVTQEQGTFQMPVNGNGGDIKGVEVSYQQVFSFLPKPLDGLGVYANFSYTDSSIKFAQMGNDIGTIALPGLSKKVANASVFYNKGGFEARVAYQHRDAYATVIAGNALLVHNGPSNTVDYEMSYTFPKGSALNGLQVQFQANNLTNDPFTTYFASPQVPGRYELFGRRFYLGVTYSF
ncbi:MAG TPA: TonB-dependent receptor [Sphingomonas sp.]|nr:TonB-dependent receptor [Sphingomonas sp.]